MQTVSQTAPRSPATIAPRTLRPVPRSLVRVRALEARMESLKTPAPIVSAPVVAPSPATVVAPETEEVVLARRVAAIDEAAGTNCIWRLTEARDALRSLAESLPWSLSNESGVWRVLARVEEALWELDPFDEYFDQHPDYDLDDFDLFDLRSEMGGAQ